MTNKEIISSLRGLIGKYNLTDEEWQTIEKTIKVLRNSDEDCISRAEAIKAIRNYNVTIEMSRAIGKSQLVDIVDSINKVQEKMISELPPVTPKPMQVELEADGYADGELVYDYGKCPNCGWEFEYGDKDWEEPYCCHCGQKLHWFESEE